MVVQIWPSQRMYLPIANVILSIMRILNHFHSIEIQLGFQN